jgi:hypothetical protein
MRLCLSVDGATRLAWRAIEAIRRMDGTVEAQGVLVAQACEAITKCLLHPDVPQGGWPLDKPLRDLDQRLRKAQGTGVVDDARDKLEAIEAFRPNLGLFLRDAARDAARTGEDR